MNEELSGIGQRLLVLRAKLKAREGKKEYKENTQHIRDEIARLERITLEPATVASQDGQEQ